MNVYVDPKLCTIKGIEISDCCMEGVTTVRISRTFKAIQKIQGPRKFRLEWPLTWRLSGAEDTAIKVSHTQPEVLTLLLMNNTRRVMVPH